MLKYKKRKTTYILVTLSLFFIIGGIWLNYAIPQKKYDIPVSKIYVINLDRSKDRLEEISKSLKSQELEFTRFPAILGLNLKIETEKGKIFTGQDLKDGKETFRIGEEYKIYCPNITLNYRYYPALSEAHGYPLSAGEFGIYCSHMEVMLDVVKHGYKSAVVLEDDVEIPDNFAKELKHVEKNMPNYKNYDLIFLCNSSSSNKWLHSKLKKKKIMFNDALDKITDYQKSSIGCVHSMMYGYYGARRMLSYLEPHTAVDADLFRLIKQDSLNAFKARNLNIDQIIGVESEIYDMGRTPWQYGALPKVD